MQELSIITIEDFPYGKENAISKNALMSKYRLNYKGLKKYLGILRNDYSICYSQDGTGYYRPTEKDIEGLRQYIKQETLKAETINKRIKASERLLSQFETK